MTTLTTEQLDELEAAARKAWTDRPRDPFEIPGHWWRLTPDVTLRLVAIARAALVWSEAHDELQGAHYMAVAGSDPGPARERYGQAIAALQAALQGIP